MRGEAVSGACLRLQFSGRVSSGCVESVELKDGASGGERSAGHRRVTGHHGMLAAEYQKDLRWVRWIAVVFNLKFRAP